MKLNIRHLVLYFLTIALFFSIIIIFLVIFCFQQTNVVLYIICALLLVVCGASYYVVNKKVTCDDGYTFIQAYFFYKKCLKEGVNPEPSRIDSNDLKIICDMIKKYDYCEGFDTDKAKGLFTIGYDVSKIM